MAKFDFVTLDVFTDKRFCGNPLAVIFGADGFSDRDMQNIAREFKLSETTFVTSLDDKAHTARLRIFTPSRELPFAGHPVIGTAIAVAARTGLNAGGEVMLALTAGNVSVEVGTGHGGVPYASFDAPGLPRVVPGVAGNDVLGAALGVEPGQIGFAGHEPRIVDGGFAMTFVPMSGLAAVAQAHIDPAYYYDTLGASDAPFVYVYCGETKNPDARFHGRMFAPTGGIPEDPATGSAITALPAQLAAAGELADGSQNWTIEQGIEMGRPSLIYLQTRTRNSILEAVTIGGSAVQVSAGQIMI